MPVTTAAPTVPAAVVVATTTGAVVTPRAHPRQEEALGPRLHLVVRRPPEVATMTTIAVGIRSDPRTRWVVCRVLANCPYSGAAATGFEDVPTGPKNHRSSNVNGATV
jgi:hypothetical protein